jgi:hypothetical protein
MREETTSRVMAADRPYGEFYYFYSVNTEYFEYQNVCGDRHEIIHVYSELNAKHVNWNV